MDDVEEVGAITIAEKGARQRDLLRTTDHRTMPNRPRPAMTAAMGLPTMRGPRWRIRGEDRGN